MRYIMLALIVILLSKTMPVVELGDKTSAVEGVPVEVLSSVAVLPSVEVDDVMGITFSSFQGPLRDPVKSVLEPATRPVSLGSTDNVDLAAKAGDEQVPRVGEMATTRGGINLQSENMIGIFGKTSDLQAILRRPDGSILKVKVGDAALGGRVHGIDEESVVIARNDDIILLRMPKL